ncbi:MAG TPA: terminase small subunit [Candidatus Bathyarchaeia archaeon]|nr:terminase small subunit [Candidatus Bathyarchaeia archaeon]
MARARDPNRDKAFEIWKQSNGTIKLKDIADQLGISEGTVRGWKNKDKWDSQWNGTLRSTERNATKQKERSAKTERREESQQAADLDDDGLTEKQRFFVSEYLRDFNATRAAMAVGYSKKTAYANGWTLLRNVGIQAEIKRQKELRAAELGLEVQRIIMEYMKIAFADISDVLDFGSKTVPLMDKKGNVVTDPHNGEAITINANYVALRDSDEIDTSVISEIKEGKDGVSVKLHDKMRALEKLEKYVDFMTEEDRLRMQKLRGEIAIIEQKANPEADKPIEIIIKRKGDAS